MIPAGLHCRPRRQMGAEMNLQLRAQARQRPRRLLLGLSLIEVLVTIVIFSFGLLGFIGLQARAMQYSVSAEDSNRAALLANELSATMTTSQTVNVPSAVVTAWKTRVSDPIAGLPNGDGDVTLNANVATITLTWRANNKGAAEANAVNRYVTQVLLP